MGAHVGILITRSNPLPMRYALRVMVSSGSLFGEERVREERASLASRRPSSLFVLTRSTSRSSQDVRVLHIRRAFTRAENQPSLRVTRE